MKKRLLISTSLSIAILLSACNNEEQNLTEQEENAPIEETNEQQVEQETPEQQPAEEQTGVIAEHDFYEPFQGNIEHVHGLGYAGNQNAIFLAAHDGLKVFENGKWYKTKDMNNDYMGFNAVDQGFYTSGHPGEGVDLPNPLGLKRSFDNGQTLEDLGLEGESDFHAMGVGYNNHTVYVVNGHKNSKMGQGLYVTKDNGKNWTEVKSAHLSENIFSIAVHPTNDQIVALGAKEGIYLSQDGGQSFSLLTTNKQGTSTFFTEDSLWFGAYDQEPILVKYTLDSGEQNEISLPKMDQDAVMYLAQNPQNQDEIVFTSFNGDTYLSKDSGNKWNQLTKQGKIQ